MERFLPKSPSCPACAASALAFELKIHYWRENPLDFERCGNCGLTFSNPMPSNELIARGNGALVRFYEKDRTLEAEFHDARQSYLRGKILGKNLRNWKAQGKALELGSYTGFLLLGLKEKSGWDVEGLEISEDLARVMEGALGIRCHQGTLEELKLPENQFDFIICHDLIEHINQPDLFLRELFRVLKPGGRVQIRTPNARQDLAYSKRAFQAGYPVGMLLNHILMFTPKALRIASERVGFKVRKLYCYDIRYAAKDFGLFGLEKPKPSELPPSMEEALRLPKRDLISHWNSEKIRELREHKKSSDFYGFLRETLPSWLSFKVPGSIAIGHEIYALIEKPVHARN